MGASRKLQGEIDRVLKKVQEGVDVFDSIWNKVYDTDNANQKEKFEADLKKEIKKLQRYRDQIKTWIQSSEIKDKKVSASYEQALMDARKLIEREMERFKICEKETKTKAFSKEGLGQQPKADPREKAKSETRDWLNNVVGELENQIDSFEAEIEGLSVKKGKMRPPRLTHLETSITRHKAHIKKLEMILRLLDNDQFSPEQVNDVKDFLDDYVERNQEDFDEFSDVDDLYSSLPLDKVESLEELVTIGASALGKATVTTSIQQVASVLEQVDETTSQDSNSDTVARTPPPKNAELSSSAPQTPLGSHATSVAGAAVDSSAVTMSTVAEEEETFSGRKSSIVLAETGLRGVSRSLSSQPSSTIPLSSGTAISSSGALGALPSPSEMVKTNSLGPDDRLGNGGMMQSLVSPVGNRIVLQQAAKANDGLGSADTGNVSEGGVVGGKVFSPSGVPGKQWRPGSSFQHPNEAGQIRGRAEIAPDQREKYLQRYQQFTSQSSSVAPQLGLGVGVQAAGLNNVMSSASLQQQPGAIHQPSNQQAPMSTISREADEGLTKVEELQEQQAISAGLAAESGSNSGRGKNLMQDDELKPSYALDAPQAGVAGSLAETSQVMRDTDISPGQPLQSNPPSGRLGVIGRRSVSDLGAIGDNITASAANPGGFHDQLYNLQMLEAAYYKLPQLKDSERAKSYTPRHPAVTPSSFPQVQAPIVNNPSFWERLGSDAYGTDTLFFTFYYQQNTYQQYLAAKELKKQSWRYHRKHNTWFQRHEEPKVATDDYEQGTYVYFDFHIGNDEQHGWCQRIKTEFTFEYNFLEDELIV